MSEAQPQARHATVLFIFITVVVDVIAFGIIIPVLPQLVVQFEGGDIARGAQVYAVFGSMWALMQFFFAPILGALSDRFGRRPVILTSIFGLGVDYVFMALAPNLTWLFVGRMISGITASNFATAGAYIADVTPPEKRAAGFGMIGAAFGLGFIFGPALGGWLKTSYGIASVGLTAAGFSLVNLVLAFIRLPESLKEKKASHHRTSMTTAISSAFQHRGKRRLLLLSLFFTFAFVMMQISFALLANERLGMSEREIGYTFAVMGVVAATMQGAFIGKLTARFGERRLLVTGTITMAVGLTLVPVVPAILVVAITLPVISIGSGMINPSVAALLSSFSTPMEQGETLGLSQSASSLARIIGPVVGSLLYELEYHTPYFVGGAVMLFCAALVYPLLHFFPRREDVQEPSALDHSA